MARPLRLHIPGTVYHLFSRGDNKGQIFRDETDYSHFLTVLAASLTRLLVECLAYCLLSNHYHLLVIPRDHSVSRLMQQVNSTYCQWFNRRHGRVGHVLQGRFGSRIVDNDAYFLTALRYVAMNPVAAGYTSDPAKWTWSSYRATAGLCASPAFLTLGTVWHAMGCSDPSIGRAQYIDLVNQTNDIEELKSPLIFGSERLSRTVAPLLQPHCDNREFVYADRFADRPALAAILLEADSDLALKRIVGEAFHRYAYSLREIADMVGRSPSTIARWAKESRSPGSDLEFATRPRLRHPVNGKFKI